MGERVHLDLGSNRQNKTTGIDRFIRHCWKCSSYVLTPLFMGLFCSGGGWWVLGGRAEWTDRRLPIIGGRAPPRWRGGGRGGQIVYCTVFYPTYPLTLAQLILLYLLTWSLLLYLCSLQPLPTPTMPSFSPPISIPNPSNPDCISALSATPPTGMEDKHQVFPPRLEDNIKGEFSEFIEFVFHQMC